MRQRLLKRHQQENGVQRSMKLLAIISRIYDEFSEDRIPAVAGGVTFFFLLALFPAIGSVVSLYGLFADRQTIVDSLQMISGFLPGGAVTVLGAEVHRLTTQKPSALNLAFVLSAIVALWSTSGGVKAVLDGLNIAFETKETRSFFRLSLNAVLFATAAVAAVAMVIYGVSEMRRLVETLSWGGYLRDVWAVLVWPAAFVACSTIVSLIYRYGPNRVRTPWRWITWGAPLPRCSGSSVPWLLPGMCGIMAVTTAHMAIWAQPSAFLPGYGYRL